MLSCYFFRGALIYPTKLEWIILPSENPSCPKESSQFIRDNYISKPETLNLKDASSILFFKIEKPQKRTSFSPRIWIFSREGNFLGQHWDRGKKFNGVNPDKRRFRKGDIVQFITEFNPRSLQLGVILKEPLSKQKAKEVNFKIAPLYLDESDNTYVVYTHSGDDFAHCFLFNPEGVITKSDSEKLFGLLALSQERC